MMQAARPLRISPSRNWRPARQGPVLGDEEGVVGADDASLRLSDAMDHGHRLLRDGRDGRMP
jgi:hypothetical protein